MPIEYKGYQIYNEIKTVKNCRNPISGHEWSESKDTGKFRIVGGKIITRVFKSVEKAKEQIDFYDKWMPKETT